MRDSAARRFELLTLMFRLTFPYRLLWGCCCLLTRKQVDTSPSRGQVCRRRCLVPAAQGNPHGVGNLGGVGIRKDSQESVLL
jgi:hypothetical protein